MEADWREELDAWLAPFQAALRNKVQARMCPAYVAGLIGPGDRKSIQPMAARDANIGYDRLHHFIASEHLGRRSDRSRAAGGGRPTSGGPHAWLIIDDTSLAKKGVHSVGVAPQYASALGKNANCQTRVSLTLASREVPIMIGLRLFLPESWTSDLGLPVRACPKIGALIARSPRLRSPRSTGYAVQACGLAACSPMPVTAFPLVSGKG